MIIQPLSNNALPAHTAPVSAKPAPEPGPAKGASPHASSSPEQVETQRSNQVDKQSLLHAAQKANQAIEGLRSDLKFTVDQDTGSNVVQFIDTRTKEVVRQIPAQEMLEIAKRLDELRGLLIKERV